MREAYIEFNNEAHKDGWYWLKEPTIPGFITFLTSTNTFTLPKDDFKKIKERGGYTE